MTVTLTDACPFLNVSTSSQMLHGMSFHHNLIQSFMPALYVVVGSEWATVVPVLQVKIVVSHQPVILKIGDGIKRSEPQTQSLPFK